MALHRKVSVMPGTDLLVFRHILPHSPGIHSTTQAIAMADKVKRSNDDIMEMKMKKSKVAESKK